YSSERMFYNCVKRRRQRTKASIEVARKSGAEDEIRTRDPRLGKAMRYRCATSACGVREMIANPTRKGKTTEAIILSILAQQGKAVLVPWGEERYDLALDDD